MGRGAQAVVRGTRPLPFPVVTALISGRVDRASAATETTYWVRFPVGSNQQLLKLLFTATLIDLSNN